MTTDPQVLTRPTITERLADYIVDLRYEDLPSSVIAKVKDHLVNHFGNAFGARRSESGRRAVNLALELAGRDGDCVIVGDNRRANLLDAVFANAFLMGGGLDDTHPASGAHPGVIVQPVAWATGERERAPGRELLTAVVAGYDVMTRLCNVEWTRRRKVLRRPNNVVGPFGGAATAARLLKLSREQTASALGHAGQAGMGLYEGVRGQQPMHPLLARNGLMAAMLAKADLAASRTIIEGQHGVLASFFPDVPAGALEANLATLGQEFEIWNTRLKPYRASSSNIVPIELMIGLTNAHALTPDHVAAIEVTVAEERFEREQLREAELLCPTTDSACRAGSLRFQLAVVAAEGRRNEARFDQPPSNDLLAMLERIRLRFEHGLPIRGARIDVTTTDGHRYSAEGANHETPPINWDGCVARDGRALLSEDQLARLMELIRNLEDVADVAQVMACVAPSNRR